MLGKFGEYTLILKKLYINIIGDGIDFKSVLYIGSDAEVYVNVERSDIYGNMAALDVEGTNVIVPGSTVFATSGGRNSMDDFIDDESTTESIDKDNINEEVNDNNKNYSRKQNYIKNTTENDVIISNAIKKENEKKLEKKIIKKPKKIILKKYSMNGSNGNMSFTMNDNKNDDSMNGSNGSMNFTMNDNMNDGMGGEMRSESDTDTEITIINKLILKQEEEIEPFSIISHFN
ncbi:hypothetical protein U3516DRAFT_754745 [Neocallimastix sp. 'constans']